MVYARACRRRRGFSLLEALFAMVVLFMVLGMFLTLLPFSLQKNEHDALYLQAVAAGQEYLDALRDSVENDQPPPSPPTIAIDAGGSVVGNGYNQSPGNFSISGSCKNVVNLESLSDCTVDVQWTENNQTRTYVVESYATQQVS
jgi:type II secretory pathway pseudopilin PulG